MSELTHIIVAGTPGALLGVAATVLSKSGLQVLWDGQDIDVTDGESLAGYSHNVEVHNIHKLLLLSLRHTWLSDRMPVYFDCPYPGPKEYLSKFKRPAVIVDPLLPPFINMWQPYVDIVIDVQASEADDLAALKRWSHNTHDDDYLRKVAKHYSSRYSDQLREFANVFQITNSELKSRQFAGLSGFLSEVFNPV